MRRVGASLIPCLLGVLVGLTACMGVSERRQQASGSEEAPEPLAPPAHAAQVRAAAERILACIQPDGAINVHERLNEVRICPYFANLSCWGLLKAYASTRDQPYLAAARRWLVWYSDHLQPDGTVHDYVGGSCPDYHDTGDCDGADSYAATFVYAVWLEHRITADTAFLRQLYPHVLRALAAVEDLRQDDGLTWAKRSYKVAYTGDNVEVWLGLTAADAMSRLCDPARAPYYRQWADQVRASILRELWNARTRWFRVAQHAEGRRDIYPGAFANLWPLTFLLDPQDAETRALLDRTVAWTFPAEDGFSPVDTALPLWYALAAQRGGDMASAARALRAFRELDAKHPRLCHANAWLIFLHTLRDPSVPDWARPTAYAALPAQNTARTAQEQFTSHLDQQILPLWTAPCLEDKVHGGFLNVLNDEGKPAGQVSKTLIAHLRLLWVHAVAIERAAVASERQRWRHQYERQWELLLQRFWDESSGAWFSAVTRAGRPADVPKNVINQVYALYVLAELARRLDSDEALSRARTTFQMLDSRTWDPVHGGYCCSIDGQDRFKDVAVNFHALLALTRLVEADPAPLHKQRLVQLFEIVTTRFLDPVSGHGYLLTSADWKPVLQPPRGSDATLFGHNAEMLWYAMDAASVLGRDASAIRDWLTRGTDALIRDGMTPEGAVFCTGTLDGQVRDRDIHFWTQAEAMILFLRLYELTEDERYWDCFQRVRRWTFTYMVDPVTGLWRTRMKSTGENLGGGFPGSEWRAGLHVVRMLLQAEAVLSRLDAGSARTTEARQTSR